MNKISLFFLSFCLLVHFVRIECNKSKGATVLSRYPQLAIEDEDDDSEGGGHLPSTLLKEFSRATIYCGGIYVGFRAWNFLREALLRRQKSSIRTSVVADPGPTQTTGTSPVMSENTSSTLESATEPVDTSSSDATQQLVSLKRDQEELWRIVHNIYEGQSGKITSLESTTAATGASMQSIQTSISALRADVLELTSSISSLRSQMVELESSIPEMVAHRSQEDASVTYSSPNLSADNSAQIEELEQEVGKTRDAITSLKSDIEAAMKVRDERLLGKVKKFGEDLQQLIKEERKARSTRNNK